MALVAMGIAAGVLLAALVTRFIASLLYAVRPIDPITFAGVAAVLIVAGVAASGIPAVSASCVDPIRTLKGD